MGGGRAVRAYEQELLCSKGASPVTPGDTLGLLCLCDWLLHLAA